MIKLKAALEKAVLSLSSDTPRLDAEVLLCFALNKPRAFLYTYPEYELTQAIYAHFNTLIHKRSLGHPIAYLVQQKEFWSMSLTVNSKTLIPRPETEEMIETLLKNHSGDKPLKVLDLGTGSGAIALALKKERPLWQIHACDQCDGALEIAKLNAKKLDLHINFCQSDWFSAYSNTLFDLIISNPPYIASHDIHLNQGDLRFEPQTALVGGESGLEDIQHIVSEANAHLTPHGFLYIEHGYNQKNDLHSLLQAFNYDAIQTYTDLNGLNRFTKAKKR